MSAKQALGIAVVGAGAYGLYRLLSSNAFAQPSQPLLQAPSNLETLTGTVDIPNVALSYQPPSYPSATTDTGLAPPAQLVGGMISSNNALDELNTSGVSSLADAIERVETGDNPHQVNKTSGATGAMQLLPSTAQAMARESGIAYDYNRLLTDTHYNEQLGRRYFNDLLSQYGNNKIAAITAYFAGPTNVNSWLARFGVPNVTISAKDWLSAIGAAGNPKTAQYAYNVAANIYH